MFFFFVAERLILLTCDSTRQKRKGKNKKFHETRQRARKCQH